MTINIERDGRGYVLTARVEVDRPLVDVFPFFADATNLNQLMPARLHFEVLTPSPIVMAEGFRIDYRVRPRGIPIRWQSEITVWDPPNRFVDEQRRGPYRWWKHEHTFKETDGRTTVADRVEYGVLGGALVNRWFVEPDLRAIFAYRCSQVDRILE